MISTHVLDTASGRPAAAVEVVLEVRDAHAWRRVGGGRTDDDGRLRGLLPDDEERRAGVYRLVFATGAWFAARNQATFHPTVTVEFEVLDPAAAHHVPLLLSPYGYTTYRGS